MALIIGAVLVAVAACVGAVMFATSGGYDGPRTTIRGEVNFLATKDNAVIGRTRGADGQYACRGKGKAGFVHAGTEVELFIDGGERAGTGTLSAGRYSGRAGDLCGTTFVIRNAPARADDYALVVANRNPVSFTREEITGTPAIMIDDDPD